MSKRSNYIVVILFLGFIGGFFLLNLFTPDRVRSEQENRYLQTFPKFSFSSLFHGEYIPKVESYCSDQFAVRDQWITMKAGLEIAQGKIFNNGIFLSEDGRLIKPFSVSEESALDGRIKLAEEMQIKTGLPVTLGLIPGAAAFYGDKLPKGADTDEQSAAIRYLCEHCSLDTVDVFSALSGHESEYIFYNTDHHWTTLGAFYAYQQLGNHLGYTPLEISDFSPRIVSDDFFGTAYSTSGFTWVHPDSIEVWCDAPDNLSVTRFELGNSETIPLYDESKLKTKDKYSYFLGGNAPCIVLETGNEGPSLLVLRDSYMDALAPFLTRHFSEIHLLDLRYFRDSLSAYAKSNEIDGILVLYSVENFCTDTNLSLMIG